MWSPAKPTTPSPSSSHLTGESRAPSPPPAGRGGSSTVGWGRPAPSDMGLRTGPNRRRSGEGAGSRGVLPPLLVKEAAFSVEAAADWSLGRS
uniref:Uncharacterized protein n=1 Tax=Arundo donax TaxID=35708 RepID=A0A0A8YSZ3_ARUDO